MNFLKTFQKPLTAREEKEYLKKYLAGDRAARDILIVRNLRLVAHIVKKYQNPEEDPEDLISIGTIGLIKAVSTFNPDRNNRLAAYAAKCVEKATLFSRLHLTLKRGFGILFLPTGFSGKPFSRNFIFYMLLTPIPTGTGFFTIIPVPFIFRPDAAPVTENVFYM